jgi:hypothetical protein
LVQDINRQLLGFQFQGFCDFSGSRLAGQTAPLIALNLPVAMAGASS